MSISEFKIQNIVGSCDLQFAISLEGLSAEHSNSCTYESEIFPGLIYKMQSPKLVLLIFASGKMVITGAKTKEDIDKAYKQIYPVLSLHNKNNNRISNQRMQPLANMGASS